MPLIDLRCTGPEPHDFEYMRPLAEWPATPPCVVCSAPTVQMHFPKGISGAGIDPIVVFRAPDGTHRFPGDADGPGARKYERLGYQRIEVRSGVEMHRLENRINAHIRAERQPAIEAQARQREERERQSRSILRDNMRGMSQYGRDVAREAMRIGDAKRRVYTTDPGIHSEALAYDRGNRAESRDAQGRRRRD